LNLIGFAYLCTMILLTGASGLLGSRLLLDLLEAGNRVRVLQRNNSRQGNIDRYLPAQSPLRSQIEWVNGDVTDISALIPAFREIKQVYHCAGKVSFQPADREVMHNINIEGTANLVNLSIDMGISKFCHVSSIAALGRTGIPGTINETATWKTSSHNSEYAISKYGAEREVWRGVAEGLNAVIINPGVIIGPGNWKTDSSMIFGQVQKGLKFYTDGVNGFVDVRDVSKAAIQLMQSNVSGERFIVVGESKPFRDVFDRISDRLNQPRPRIHAGPVLTGIAWRIERLKSMITGSKPVITKETARSASGINYYDNSKLKSTLKIDFIPVDQAIDDAASFFIKEVQSK
jgi:dihydroflavonol-4-reductase